jgi:polysaccharide deacetylase 2 family uncharacterized protein YibQ
MTTKKTKTDKKGERKGKTSKKSSIRSPKKKPKIRIKELIDTKRRYLVVSGILLLCIVTLAFVAFGLFKKRVEPVFPQPSLTGVPYSPPEGEFRIERDIGAVNEEITRSLLELGYSESSRTTSEKKNRVTDGVHYREISESYLLEKGGDKRGIVKFLVKRLEDFGDDVAVKETDSGVDNLYIVFYVHDRPVRRLTFSTESSRTSKTVKPPRVGPVPRVAIIVDDMGTNSRYLNELLELKYPVTISVMPHRPSTAYVANRAHRMGAEVMLHLPMEPIDYPNINPGSGALFTFMDEEMFKNSLVSDLASVPHIVGVNNHMGSRLTQDEDKMRLVLNEIEKRGLFFVDSRTTHKTVAYELAVRMGIPAAERSVFLDNENDLSAVKEKIRELIATAKREGKALAICHPRSETIRALKVMEPTLTSGKVKVVTVKELIKRK